ncbi:MAG: amylo-alpha-1,6-glucosidase [Anaeromyxobacteraceae bacterium]
MHVRRLAVLAAPLLLAACGGSKPVTHATPLSLDDLGVEVTAGASRGYFFTDKGDAYLYGEAAGPQAVSWQGFNVRGFTFVDDWHWSTAGAGGAFTALGWSHFAGATVFPDRAVRRYAGGLSETITVVEGKRALLVEPAGAGALLFRPVLADSTKASSYEVRLVSSGIAIARTNHLTQNGPNDWPVWLVAKAAGSTGSTEGLLVDGGGLKPKLFSPASLLLAAPAPVALAVGETLAEAEAAADAVLAGAAAAKAARRDRLAALLEEGWVRTGDPAFDRAAAWIRLSMDALVMDQQGKGIFAGLPWFNNYWGRDTFITLAGSHLATGRWEEAEEILSAFAAHQDVDDASATYGRIPNQVSLSGVSYNTADGTPWFVVQAAATLDRTGDAAFAAEIWPVVERATAGALRHVDAQGFLLHGDQETWMDATGPDGPYTPRGSRAVEIQGLFHRQLVASAAIADRVGAAAEAAAWRAADAKLVAAFLPAYTDPARLTLLDRLRADGSADAQVRPNQLIALRAMQDVLPAGTVRSMARGAAERLGYPHGVASLWPADPAFHPYHLLPGYYPKDAAYHNGVVWCWLSGPLVSLMAGEGAAEKAYEQLRSLGGLALERATIGTLPELLDALPRLAAGSQPPALGDGEPEPAGTPFQAWSHGEYLRNVWEDLVGVRYASPARVTLAPHLPAAWGVTTARFRMGDGAVVATLTPGAGSLAVELTGEGALPAGATVTIEALGASREVAVARGKTARAKLGGAGAATGWEGFTWHDVELPLNLPALQLPGFVVLDRAVIKAPAEAGATTRLALSDPAGDDTGPAGMSYTYPTDVHFQPGILDLTGFELREDSSAFHVALDFANLVQPGWNPQDGFQLTYAAIVFDTGTAASVGTVVAHKSGYTLPAGSGYEFAIYVGAGLEVADAAGAVLATYVPAGGDVVDPLGSADTRRVSFRLPKTVIPALPAGTKVTLLVGSQDDYGNGSMGDFRAVAIEAGQWTGGGNTASGPFFYDLAAGILQ